MREYLLKTKKVGGQTIIELPAELLRAEQIQPDMVVKVTVQKYVPPSVAKARADASLGPDDPWKLLE